VLPPVPLLAVLDDVVPVPPMPPVLPVVEVVELPLDELPLDELDELPPVFSVPPPHPCAAATPSAAIAAATPARRSARVPVKIPSSFMRVSLAKRGCGRADRRAVGTPMTIEPPHRDARAPPIRARPPRQWPI
jgi:hypothetical protein